MWLHILACLESNNPRNNNKNKKRKEKRKKKLFMSLNWQSALSLTPFMASWIIYGGTHLVRWRIVIVIGPGPSVQPTSSGRLKAYLHMWVCDLTDEEASSCCRVTMTSYPSYGLEVQRVTAYAINIVSVVVARIVSLLDKFFMEISHLCWGKFQQMGIFLGKF